MAWLLVIIVQLKIEENVKKKIIKKITILRQQYKFKIPIQIYEILRHKN